MFRNLSLGIFIFGCLGMLYNGRARKRGWGKEEAFRSHLCHAWACGSPSQTVSVRCQMPKSFCVGNLRVACKTLSDSRFILVPSPAMNVGRNYSVFHCQSPQAVRHRALYLVGALVSDGFPSQGEILITKIIQSDATTTTWPTTLPHLGPLQKLTPASWATS